MRNWEEFAIVIARIYQCVCEFLFGLMIRLCSPYFIVLKAFLVLFY